MAKTDFKLTVLSISKVLGEEKKKRLSSAYQKQATTNYFNTIDHLISELLFTRPVHNECLKVIVKKKKCD